MSGRLLGVVLAGGRSTRFGSDKALAQIRGTSLLDTAIASLRQWCAQVVVAGREGAVQDWPQSGMGPLGGIAGGLRHAQEHGFEAVLTCGVDSIGLPGNLRELLSRAPAFVESQPVIGIWPVGALSQLEAILNGDGRHSVLAFANAIGARPVRIAGKPANINTPQDLAKAEKYYGL